GAKSIDAVGTVSKEKGTADNAMAVVYVLRAVNSPITLTFLPLNQNLLHLLDGNKQLINGGGAWSYTLNRTKTAKGPGRQLPDQIKSSRNLCPDTSIIGIFGGRSHCNPVLCELNGVSTSGCQGTKYKLTLFKDAITHAPSTFTLLSVQVGKGDTQYKNEGKWRLTQGIQSNPKAVVYELELDPARPHLKLWLLKGDENTLFFVDAHRQLMVGDADFSYTLNRKQK